MRVIVFAGFLGAGKTSVILRLAERLTAQGTTSCYIVNEVGEIGIDGALIRDGGLEVREITAGCICCSIAVDLVTTLNEVTRGFDPDVVIVEASGVAKPAGIEDALSYYSGELDGVPFTVTVLDPTRLEAFLEAATPLIEGQIEGADYVIITRLDEASATERAFARDAVARLRPGVTMREVSAVDGAGVAEALDGLLARAAG